MKKFNLQDMKPIKRQRNTKLIKVDPVSFLKIRENVIAAISEAIVDGDKEALQEIIIGYLSIINKEELARVSKLPIATIRRVAAGSNYNIDTLLKITWAINKAA